jgi:sugar phosphate isomerase/epimerase
MLRLCAFADEISPDLAEQIRVCRACGIPHVELRSVGDTNVLDFNQPVRAEIKARFDAAGIGVACIGSPVGKVPISEPWEKHFDRFKIAIDAAAYFGAPMVRIFSYYPPREGEDVRKHRDEVIRRMRAKVEHVTGGDITLVHENEQNIYGQRARDCLDLMRAVNSPHLRCAFDFANFVVCGEKPQDAWPLLKPYTTHFHLKDARLRDRTICPAGEGDGDIEPILVDACFGGYRGFLSLEPHLSAAGQFSGFSGAKLFGVAVTALRALCDRAGIPLAS